MTAGRCSVSSVPGGGGWLISLLIRAVVARDNTAPEYGFLWRTTIRVFPSFKGDCRRTSSPKRLVSPGELLGKVASCKMKWLIQQFWYGIYNGNLVVLVLGSVEIYSTDGAVHHAFQMGIGIRVRSVGIVRHSKILAEYTLLSPRSRARLIGHVFISICQKNLYILGRDWMHLFKFQVWYWLSHIGQRMQRFPAV